MGAVWGCCWGLLTPSDGGEVGQAQLWAGNQLHTLHLLMGSLTPGIAGLPPLPPLPPLFCSCFCCGTL